MVLKITAVLAMKAIIYQEQLAFLVIVHADHVI